MEAFQTGDFETAIQLFTESIAFNPGKINFSALFVLIGC